MFWSSIFGVFEQVSLSLLRCSFVRYVKKSRRKHIYQTWFHGGRCDLQMVCFSWLQLISDLVWVSDEIFSMVEVEVYVWVIFGLAIVDQFVS